MTEPFPFTIELALDLWYTALGCEFGIIIPIVDPKDTQAISNRMYDAKKDINDPRLEALSQHIPADRKAIFVYKKEVELDD